MVCTYLIFVGVAVGMGMVCFDDIIEHGTALKSKGYRGVNPHFVPRVLINMPAGHLSLKYGLRVSNQLLSVTPSGTNISGSLGLVFLKISAVGLTIMI